MRPRLAPGDEFVATDSRAPRLGEVVAFLHPDRPGFWMVKRLVEPPEPLDNGLGWVMSDNPGVTTADSRTLGPLPLSTMWPMVCRLDAESFVEGTALLAAEEPALAAVVAEHGVPQFWCREPGFATLTLFILEQQVSLESGAAVFRRLLEATGEIEPGSILGLGPAGLAAVGITRQKTGYILSIAEQITSGQFDPASLGGVSAAEARRLLVGLPGVGPWTADVYLLSVLGHPDIFPVGDRALQVGAAEALGMSTPDPDELELVSQPWRPLRAVAARLIWHSYLSRRGRVEPPDPFARRPRRVEA